MNSRANNEQTGVTRLWPTAALILIAVVISFVGGVNGLESWVYDYFQRYQYKAASDQILLVTVDSRADKQQDIWTDTGFRNLTRALSRYGARLTVATQPLALPDVPSEDQIRALMELQEQARRSSSGGFGTNNQLLSFRERFDHREALVSQMKSSGNVVLTTYSTTFSGEKSSIDSCNMHEVNLQGTDQKSLKKVRRVRYLSSPTTKVCKSSIALGLGNFWPDNDGIVRTTDLIVNANGIYLPSLALATAAAIDGNNRDIVVASPVSLTVSQKLRHTGQGFQILNRYYNGTADKPAFHTVSADSILAGKVDPATIRNKVVLIGESTEAAMPGIKTPISLHMTPLELIATSLSNILEQDYLLRPEWLPLLESGLLIAVLFIVLLWMPIMPTPGAALMGFTLASMVISTEIWLLISEGIWVQLATTAIFTAAAVWTMHVWNLTNRRAQPASVMPQRPPRSVGGISDQSQLDLEFSVLRQQAPTEDTKEKLYDIALAHGRAKEYAHAERVLTHIADMDPNYRDVKKLLSKLSGAKKKIARRRKPGAASMPSDRQTLGRYEIDRVLGRGAMATVYLGRDPAINRKVAIKSIALAREFDEAELEDARLQFRREAESAGRLNHPNIIAIYDAGEDDDISYLAMEYFEGTSLLPHTQPDNLLPAKWVLELVARAAEALDYAHRQNVVHRDVKPANLMYHAATDALKLTDFGIARLTDSSRTKTGVILGTPSYMSPEQLSAAAVTGQSDLYSLGITMYQLLTGEAPFRADSIPKLMDKIINEDHRPASELRVDLPTCVDQILSKVMAKHPADRFANGQDMAVDLRACARSFKTQAKQS